MYSCMLFNIQSHDHTEERQKFHFSLHICCGCNFTHHHEMMNFLQQIQSECATPHNKFDVLLGALCSIQITYIYWNGKREAKAAMLPKFILILGNVQNDCVCACAMWMHLCKSFFLILSSTFSHVLHCAHTSWIWKMNKMVI